MYYSLGGAKLATVALDRELHDILFNSRPGQPDINQTNPGGVVHAWVGQIVTVPSDRPVRPRPRFRVATGRPGCSHRFTGRLFPCKACCSTRVRVYRSSNRCISMFVDQLILPDAARNLVEVATQVPHTRSTPPPV